VRNDAEAFFLVCAPDRPQEPLSPLLDRQGERWSGIVSGRMELLVR